MNTANSNSEERASLFQILMLLLSVYALGAIFVQSAFRLPENVDALLERIDFIVCGVFFADFCLRLHRARSKARFMKWGWIDLISSIPKFEIFRFGRMLRIIRILRMLRAFRSAKVLVKVLFANRARSAVISVAAISIVLALFSSIAILNFETATDSNIKSPADALWWAATTITTVGYGDRYPVTPEGRIVAVFLMIAGVGLFGTFTGFIASLFVSPEAKNESAEIRELISEVRELKEKLIELKPVLDLRKDNPKNNEIS